ncbi:quinone-dependent dihydroorotate dehydrogenase [Terrihabitans rhizophilus]|uniref:Dihydroorotate dehydrogenase (quinone) n=1 Tax=Terrihabitans rhizophilus TaxID=3092662 RepID=A0ABU4RNF5_9HYPH|nr:quinone-dependent dihydroorotate dehydrogenase [Terrihabitans sp. PJ23]MDX6806362.1 quinone-dependent dihydroorotate dehydrogenase [Terrihabitans sp. PJ23]
MITAGWPLLRSVLGGVDPERAHDMTISALESVPMRAAPPDDPRLAVEAFGLRFPNPVGLAAGFDKDGRVPDPLLRMGFGFVEVGSITPKAQPGNPKPRIFRLPEAKGVINRLGFNNAGHQAALTRLSQRAGRPGIVGVNVGANKDALDRAADYAAGVRAFSTFASYLTINISSPNTPGLRDLQARDALDDLLARVMEAREEARIRRPVLLKLAPDLALDDLDDAVEVALARGVDGLIVSNTTITRPPGLTDAAMAEAGGLSGAPLFRRATWMLAQTARRTEGRVPLVGVGGVDSAETALAKLRAGASLVQLYTAMTYNGPGLIGEIKTGLLAAMEREAAPSITDFIGRDRDAIAAEGPG